MGSKRHCENLTLARLKLTKSSVDVLNEELEGGTLYYKISSQFQVAKGEKINDDNPGRVSVTVLVEGTEHKEAESEVEKEKAFSITATMVGLFHATGGAEFSVDQFTDCYDWVVMQAYLPLREYLTFTLSQMGLHLTLPLAIPPRNEVGEVASSAT